MGLNSHEIEGHAAEDQKQIHTSSVTVLNRIYISPHEVLQCG